MRACASGQYGNSVCPHAPYPVYEGNQGATQLHMCGNSVNPPPMAALARANDPWRVSGRQAEAA